MNKMKQAIITAVLIVFFTIIIYLLKIGGRNFIFITDVLAIFYVAVALYFGYKAYLKYTLASIHGKSLFLMLFGLFLWFLAEVLWMLFQTHVLVVLESLRLLGYIPFSIGFIYILKLSDPKFREHNKHLLEIMGLFLLFAVIYLTLVPIFFGHESFFQTITTNGYIITDFILLFGIGILLKVSHSFRGGKMSRAWMLFAVGFSFVFLFDLYFAIYHNSYYFGHIAEIFWLLGYVFVAFGFYYNCLFLESLEKIVQERKMNMMSNADQNKDSKGAEINDR